MLLAKSVEIGWAITIVEKDSGKIPFCHHRDVYDMGNYPKVRPAGCPCRGGTPKRHLVQLPVAQHVYMHVYFVHCTVCMYAITTVHLDLFRALQVSLSLLACEYHVCAYAHTHNSNTHQPHVENGETLPLTQTNPRTSTLETSANHRPAGKTPLPPLFCIRMQWCSKLMWIVQKNNCWAKICGRQDGHHNMIKMMSATKSTTTTAHRNSCKLRWSCASPFRSVASRRVELPLILHPTTSLFLPTKRRQRAFFGKHAFTTAKCTVAGVIPSSQHLSTYAGAESIQLI